MKTSDPLFAPDARLINKALSVIGGKWRLYIILIISQQALHFSQFNQQFPGVSEKVLAGELKALVSLGVVQRTVYTRVPPRGIHAYRNLPFCFALLRQIQQIGQLVS